ncbi:MAG: UDP-N-acetylmuramoyl-tripeptide--D-alanyl-D-alanine ligase [Ruminococcus sp.]|nr:UDP-N-acetylmuramoyl-tripeptide--D-alanyl-D-alanine ligase [Ruminococcus sp.]
MKPITLKEVAASCQGTLFGDENLKITSIVTDSRKAGEGSLFAAIKGERVDGHDFIPKVKEQGAVCVLCEKKPDADIPYILTDSTAIALKGIARYYRSLFSIPFVGITGSVGKTSTKELIYSVLKEKYNTHKTQGNFNNELGVPLTLFGLEESHEAAVIEMGISGFTEMTRLSKMVCPDISVITNIGCCHLENLKDRDGVLKAKTEMFQYLKEDGHIVLCGDDDKLSTIKEYNGIKPIFYGIDTDREYYAEDIEDNLLSGIDCVLCHGNVKIPVHIPAPGRHMVENALAAFAVGELLGLTPDEIKRGVESFKNVGSRNNIIDNGSYIVIDDCYNANPTSVKAGLDTLAPVKGRTVAVLGDMKELGTDEISLHFEVGRYAKEKGINLLIAAGPLAKSLAEGYGDGAVYYETVDLACEKIKDLIQPDDTVLVKASHSMHFEKIVEALK